MPVDEMDDPASLTSLPAPDGAANAVSAPSSAWCSGTCSWCESPALFSECFYKFRQAKYAGNYKTINNVCYCDGAYAHCW